MDDLIDRKRLLEVMNEYNRISGMPKALHEGFGAAIDFVEAAPSVDAEPVRHGRWIYDRMDVVCSHCKTSFKDNIDFIQQDGKGRFVTAKRCPNCGAKMENGGT